MIKYGMSLDYLPDWGVQEALREIYQNFHDYGTFDKSITEQSDGLKRLHLSSSYNPSSLEFLKIGESGKRGDPSSIGQHGEGLKMALMVLQREGCDAQIHAGHVLLTPTTYEDDDLGECFGIKKDFISTFIPFAVSCDVPAVDLIHYESKQLKETDILHSCYNGQLLKDKPGKIYVGGIYVCTEKELKHGYNFKPEDIDLDRDRSVPRSWNVDYQAARILESYKQIKEEDLKSRDCNQVQYIPEPLQKKFEPKLSKTGSVIFETKKGTVANDNISRQLTARPENQKKIQKLKYNMTKKRIPNTILQEYFNKYESSMSSSAKIDFKNLILRAKEWKVER